MSGAEHAASRHSRVVRAKVRAGHVPAITTL